MRIRTHLWGLFFTSLKKWSQLPKWYCKFFCTPLKKNKWRKCHFVKYCFHTRALFSCIRIKQLFLSACNPCRSYIENSPRENCAPKMNMKMVNIVLRVALVLVSAPSVLSCSCLFSTLTEKFENDFFKTIGKFCYNTPSRPFPDFENQFSSIKWKLTLKTVYKGDCSLRPGTVIKGISGANGATCGVGVENGCYLIALSENNSFNLCGLASKFNSLNQATLTELAANNQCKRKYRYNWAEVLCNECMVILQRFESN